MMQLRKVFFGVVLACVAHLCPAQGVQEVFEPTRLIEESPQVAAQYHQLVGKIDSSYPDRQVAERKLDWLAEWLESAGSSTPLSYENAHSDLVAKLAKLNANFDAAKKAGRLNNWPLTGAQQTSAQSAVQVTAVPQAAIKVSAREAAPVEAAPTNAPSTTAKKINIFALWGGMIVAAFFGFKAYPIFFAPRADGYHLSPWQRLKKRLAFSLGWAVGGLFLVGLIAPALTGK